MSSYHFYLILLVALLLAACEEQSAAAPAAGDPEPAKPWQWSPEDPMLAKGRETYLAECALCHNEGEERAPALTRAAEWQARSGKGVETLVRHAIEGFKGEDGEMPARGGSDYLTDEEVTGAVHFMLAAPK